MFVLPSGVIDGEFRSGETASTVVVVVVAGLVMSDGLLFVSFGESGRKALRRRAVKRGKIEV